MQMTCNRTGALILTLIFMLGMVAPALGQGPRGRSGDVLKRIVGRLFASGEKALPRSYMPPLCV